MDGLDGEGICALAMAPIALELSAHTLQVQLIVYSVKACWH